MDDFLLRYRTHMSPGRAGYTSRMRTCLFCDKPARSHEHLWPKWILKRHDFGPLKCDLGHKTQNIIPKPEVKVKSVCGVCNSGWMSHLEEENLPIIGSMSVDLSLTLDEEQQRSVSAWVIKTAMVLDSIRHETSRKRFYTKEACAALRGHRGIPPHARIWIGRIATKHLHASGTDYRRIQADTNEVRDVSTIASFVAGHFVAQSITQRASPKFVENPLPDLAPKPSKWEDFLIQIWPIRRNWVTWPPNRSFSNGGSTGIAYLMDRWRIGTKIDSSEGFMPPG